jgi:PAS domain S-box-containing protein
MESPNIPMFDYRQLQRFGLSKHDLPASAVILNKPLSILEEFRVFVWIGVLVMGLLTALIIVLLATLAYRRRAAAALAESEKNLAAMLNAVPESMLLINPEGTVIAINSTAALRLGSRPEAMTGRSVYNFLPSQVAATRRQRMEQAISCGEPVFFEDQREGRTIGSHLYPILDIHGQVSRLFIFGQDITEHRSIQDALLRQKELLENISNAQDLFISGEDPRRIYQDMLRILVMATGSEYGFLDEVLRDPDGTPYKLSLAMSDISWDEDSRKLYRQLVERKLEFRNLDNLSGAPVLEKQVIIANDAAAHPRYRGLPKGHPALAAYMGIPLFFGNEVIGVAGVANRPGGYDMDLVLLVEPLTKTCTAMIWAGRLELRRKQAIAALQQSEERYRCIAETANEGIWVLDAGFQTTFVNRHMAGMLGYKPEEMQGRFRDDFMFAEDFADHETRMQLRSRGRAEVYERRFQHKNGSAVWTIASGTPLLDDLGNVVGSFGMFTDITQRKAAEEELKNKSEALQQALAEKDAFFSIIAHDLRSPISGLLGLTGLLIDGEELSQEESQTVSTEMARSVRNIFDLLENLLEWSRMQRGLTTFAPEPCDLLHVAQDNAELVRSAAEQKKVTLRLAIPPECKVSADAHMLNTVLRNLLFNALKFSNHGGNVIVSAQQDADKVTVAVKDDGVGMDEQTLASLFALGRKDSRLGTAGEKGTGLGLVLCKEFIEKHGGTIRVESQPDQGATFFFTLTAKRDDQRR